MSAPPGRGLVRRSQQERTAETRERVLNAAIECLAERGYSATTTTLIAEYAGVSRGAQLHHFPKRQDLLVHALRHLAARRTEELRQEVLALPKSAEGLDAALELLWQSFSGPLFLAAVELWVASRTDVELHSTLCAVEGELGRTIGTLIGDLDPRAAGDEVLDDLIDLTVHLLRGMALQRILLGDDLDRRRQFDLWKRIVSDRLSAKGN